MNKQIFFDVTLIASQPQKKSGIIRICLEFCRWLLNNKYTEIQFVYFHAKSNNFLIMDKALLREIIDDRDRTAKSNVSQNSNNRLINWVLKKLNKKIKTKNAPTASFSQCSCFFDVCLNIEPGWHQKMIELKTCHKFKLAMLCHDLIPFFCPHYGFDSFHIAKLINDYFSFMCRYSDHIFSTSKFTANDLTRFASLNKLVPLSVSIIKEYGTNLAISSPPKSPNSVVTRLIKNDFILCVSKIENRKNHEVLYKGYLYLLEHNFKDLPKMVFCGSSDPSMQNFIKEISCNPKIKDYIIVLDNINDDDLERLYLNCLFTVYPSFYEGFGLPLIESLAHGKFCISSSATSLPEVGKDYVDYVHPLDVVGWAEKIEFYLKNKEKLHEREQYIKGNYIAPTWDDCISTMYNEVLSLK